MSERTNIDDLLQNAFENLRTSESIEETQKKRDEAVKNEPDMDIISSEQVERALAGLLRIV